MNISVIVPTYNRKNFLKKAIDSVKNQTKPPAEIIIIDDGSNDGTDQMVARDYPELKYFWQGNSGISSARNLGIKNSSGDWIAFLDSDDEWLPKKLEVQSEEIEKNPELCICHSNEIWIRNGRRVNPKKIHQKFGGYIFEKCLPLCVISPSSVIIHRSIFKQYGDFDTSLPACEDYDLWLRICAFLPVLYIDEPLIIKHGGHEDQLSKKHWGMDRFRIAALEKVMNNPSIDNCYKNSARNILHTKLKILINGAEKRGKKDNEMEQYLYKMTKYSSDY